MKRTHVAASRRAPQNEKQRMRLSAESRCVCARHGKAIAGLHNSSAYADARQVNGKKLKAESENSENQSPALADESTGGRWCPAAQTSPRRRRNAALPNLHPGQFVERLVKPEASPAALVVMTAALVATPFKY